MMLKNILSNNIAKKIKNNSTNNTIETEILIQKFNKFIVYP